MMVGASLAPSGGSADDKLEPRMGIKDKYCCDGNGLTVLSILNAGQALQTGPVEGREWLSDDGGHG